jgi:Zn-dependent M28 family amino/carboxypeptidase
VRGNHHDAWVNGANDPISGLVPLLAEAKAIGELHKSGWTPKRTIVFAAWDGEEPGLLGSTEWAEAHADELRARPPSTSTPTATGAASWAWAARTPSSASSTRSRATWSTRRPR